jgi:GNAT superfamily N-acetyltransferase
MAAVALRKANQTDAAAIGALHVTSWRETYSGLLPSKMLAELSVDARTAMWAEILGKPEDFGCAAVFIGEDNGRTVSVGACGENRRDQALSDIGFSGEIGAVYVLRSHQCRGVGRSMMAAMAHELLVAGHTSAYLWVLRQNDPARTFYEKLGGVIVGEKTDQQPGMTLVEDAYGWRHLSSLVR